MKKYLYELTNKELEKYIDTPEVQRALEYAESFTKPFEMLVDSYTACVKMKVLLEQQIEVVEE